MAIWPVEQKSTTMGQNTLQDEIQGGASGAAAAQTVAALGSIQGDAAAVLVGYTNVTGGDATKGVRLPAAAAGMHVRIKNNSAAVLKVWPAVGDGINAIAVNSALSMAAGTSADFDAIDGVTWFTTPLVPS